MFPYDAGDPDGKVWHAAVNALGALDTPKATARLASLLGHEDRDMRESVVLMLWESRLGEVHAPAVARLLRDKDEDVRLTAMYALSRLDAREFIPALLDVMEKDQDQRWDA